MKLYQSLFKEFCEARGRGAGGCEDCSAEDFAEWLDKNVKHDEKTVYIKDVKNLTL